MHNIPPILHFYLLIGIPYGTALAWLVTKRLLEDAHLGSCSAILFAPEIAETCRNEWLLGFPSHRFFINLANHIDTCNECFSKYLIDFTCQDLVHMPSFIRVA